MALTGILWWCWSCPWLSRSLEGHLGENLLLWCPGMPQLEAARIWMAKPCAEDGSLENSQNCLGRISSACTIALGQG